MKATSLKTDLEPLLQLPARPNGIVVGLDAAARSVALLQLGANGTTRIEVGMDDLLDVIEALKCGYRACNGPLPDELHRAYRDDELLN